MCSSHCTRTPPGCRSRRFWPSCRRRRRRRSSPPLACEGGSPWQQTKTALWLLIYLLMPEVAGRHSGTPLAAGQQGPECQGLHGPKQGLPRCSAVGRERVGRCLSPCAECSSPPPGRPIRVSEIDPRAEEPCLAGGSGMRRGQRSSLGGRRLVRPKHSVVSFPCRCNSEMALSSPGRGGRGLQGWLLPVLLAASTLLNVCCVSVIVSTTRGPQIDSGAGGGQALGRRGRDLLQVRAVACAAPATHKASLLPAMTCMSPASRTPA